MEDLSSNIRVVLPLAGQGSRLRPFTDTVPKSMVPFQGKTLLQRQLDHFKALKIDDITLVGGYLADELPTDYNLVLNKDFENTNMVYSLFCAHSAFEKGDKDIIIAYGDIIYERTLLAKLLQCDAPIAVLADLNWHDYWPLRMNDYLSDVEDFRWQRGPDRIVKIGSQPQSPSDVQAQYTGLIKIRADFAPEFMARYQQAAEDAFKKPKAKLDMTSYLQFLIDAGVQVAPCFTRSGWLEFDTTEDMALYNDMVNRGSLSALYNDYPFNQEWIKRRKALGFEDSKNQAKSEDQILDVARFVQCEPNEMSEKRGQLYELLLRKIDLAKNLYNSYDERGKKTDGAEPLNENQLSALLFFLLERAEFLSDAKAFNSALKLQDRFPFLKKDDFFTMWKTSLLRVI